MNLKIRYMENLKLERFIRDHIKKYGIAEGERIEQLVKEIMAENERMYEKKDK